MKPMNDFEHPQYEIDLELALERFRSLLKELACKVPLVETRTEVPIFEVRKKAA
jgi:hypothetical protein